MSANVLPLSIGQTSTNASLASLLGQRFEVQTTSGLKVYRLCKLVTALASPARKLVVSAVSGGLPTWLVDPTTTAGLLPGGVIPADHTSTIAAGSYFLLQTGGPAEVISAAAIVTMVSIGASTTAGKADDATITGGGIGYALEAAAGADENVGCMLNIW